MSNCPWSKEEDAILRENYGPLGREACFDLLPERSDDAILTRAKNLKLKTKIRGRYCSRRPSGSGKGLWAPISDAELKVMRERAPEDTRSLTGVLMGDPLPGRSALGRRT